MKRTTSLTGAFALSMAKTSNPNTGASQFFIIWTILPQIGSMAFTPSSERWWTVMMLLKPIDLCATDQNDRPVNNVVIQHAYIAEHVNFDADNDGVSNTDDNCPNIANPQQNDTDMDLIGDVCDDDIDGDDGVNNEDDAFPNDGNETTDYDDDGTGDNADADDDNDGMNDTSDAFPYDQNETTDTDGDGIGDQRR